MADTKIDAVLDQTGAACQEVALRNAVEALQDLVDSQLRQMPADKRNQIRRSIEGGGEVHFQIALAPLRLHCQIEALTGEAEHVFHIVGGYTDFVRALGPAPASGSD